MKVNRTFLVHRVLPVLLLVSIAAGLAVLAATVSAPVVSACAVLPTGGGHNCGGKHSVWDPEDKECEHLCGAPTCGMNPHEYNNVGGHFQRKFHEACQPYTGDDFETLCHNMWCDDCKALYPEVVCSYDKP